MLFLKALLPLFLLFWTTATASSLIEKRAGPVCREVNFTASVHALNKDLRLIDLSNLLGSWINFLTTFDVSGTFNIAGRYCEPEVHVAGQENTLQFLVHGITYDRNYWSGGAAPGQGFNGVQYSWVTYASKQGYPTLAIDRLGNGASDKPDPIIYVQYPFHTGSALPRTFNKIIYAGHSFGSIIGNAFVAKYPTDVNGLLFTSYSHTILLNVPGVALNAAFLPARLVMLQNPKYNRLPVEYLQLALRSAFDYLFYHPRGYDPALEQQDFTNRGTISAGELAPTALGINTAYAFAGPVYVVTGKYDNIFCNTDCGTEASGELVDTKVDYPVASSFDVHIVPNAVHCWHNHYTAGDSFANIHSWLASKGF